MGTSRETEPGPRRAVSDRKCQPRSWESTIKPPSDAPAESIEALRARYDYLEIYITEVGRECRSQIKALRRRGRRAWWGMLAALLGAMVLAWVLSGALSYFSGLMRSPPDGSEVRSRGSIGHADG
jgi:hypothetical protein